MSKLTNVHWTNAKRLLHYLKGMMHLDLTFYKPSHLDLIAYSDVDWASTPDDRKSTGAYYVFLGNNMVSWNSSKQ